LGFCPSPLIEANEALLLKASLAFINGQASEDMTSELMAVVAPKAAEKVF